LKVLKFFILTLGLLLSNQLLAQKESAYWYFGERAGLNFNTEPPTPLTNGQLNSREGCAAISDTNGSLLFYTDGISVWDRNHTEMPNGYALLGDKSSTQSAIIIPNPVRRGLYYIFTVDEPGKLQADAGDTIEGINYSEVDMTLNGGYGDVITGKKNIHLITYDTNDAIQREFKASEKITAVTNNDGTAIWVITQFVNKFYAFKVDANGVNSNPVISTVQQTVNPRLYPDGASKGANPTAIGYLKVSPNGKKLAIAHTSTNLGNPRTGLRKNGKVLLYNFDNASGMVSNQETLLDNEYPYGVEFSPNSKVLYITSSIFNSNDLFERGLLYQYNLESNNIANSKTIIDNSSTITGALQLALNGKIYRTSYQLNDKRTKLSVINTPNQLGTTCDYKPDYTDLNGRVTGQGLPAFIQSIFYYSFDYENTCLGDTTEFTITSEDPYTSVEWDFGDGSNTSTVENPTHQYTNPGTYTVSLQLYTNGVAYDPLIKQVTISEAPNVYSGTFPFTQCDSFDNNPNDGIATFNLNNTIPDITLNTTQFVNANFYLSATDADADVDNTDYIDPIYRNITMNQIVYAKVYGTNPECYEIVPIELQTNAATPITAPDQYGCDYENDGIAIFDISSIRSNIVSNIGQSGVIVTLHENPQDAAIGINPIPDNYESSNTTVYIRAVDGNSCYGGGSIELITKPFPLIEDKESIACTQNFPVIISSGISTTYASQYNYLWNTGETTNIISANASGVYQLTVTDPIVGCSQSINVTVNEVEVPVIEEIKIDDKNIEVIVNSNNGEVEYAVDNEFSNYQESNSFANLPPGEHTLYVKDTYNCTTVSQDFAIIGFPKFFTPNNDTINDSWNLSGLNPSLYNQATYVSIYNRYGKLICAFDPLKSIGWDGKYNGKLLPPDDYWYYFKLPDGKEYKGHFTLKL